MSEDVHNEARIYDNFVKFCHTKSNF